MLLRMHADLHRMDTRTAGETVLSDVPVAWYFTASQVGLYESAYGNRFVAGTA